MNIFNIGKANERITALEAELKTAKEEAKTAQESLTENSKQVEQAAEALKKERDEAKGKFDSEVSAHVVTKQKLEKAEADLKSAQTEVAGLPAKIEAEGSKKAQAVLAALGQPPANIPLTGTPAAPQSADISKLQGREKVIAAFKAQSVAKGQPK